LRAGVGFLAAADDAQVFWPARQLVAVGMFAQQGGELYDTGFVEAPGLAVAVEDGAPGGCGYPADAARSRAPSSQPME